MGRRGPDATGVRDLSDMTLARPWMGIIHNSCGADPPDGGSREGPPPLGAHELLSVMSGRTR